MNNNANPTETTTPTEQQDEWFPARFSRFYGRHVPTDAYAAVLFAWIDTNTNRGIEPPIEKYEYERARAGDLVDEQILTFWLTKMSGLGAPTVYDLRGRCERSLAGFQLQVRPRWTGLLYSDALMLAHLVESTAKRVNEFFDEPSQ